jgi:hypothetical protein
MRRVAAILVMMAVSCLAQGRGGGRHGGVGGGTRGPGHRPPSHGPIIQPRPTTTFGHGFGNVVFPATGIPNPIYPHPTTFAQRFGATISGYPGYLLGGGPRYGRSRAALVPYAVPALVDGYGFGGYGYGYGEPAPNVTIVNAPQPPPVIINQNYTPDRANPVVRDYTNENLPEPTGLQTYQAPIPNNPEGARTGTGTRSIDPDKPTVYLIAFRDGNVYSAYAWWVEGATLHYVTTRYSHNRASVELIDSDLSQQLNVERGVEFKIPVKAP